MFSSLKRHDWLLNFFILALAAASLLMIFGISLELFFQQLAWFTAAFLAIGALSLADWRAVINYRWMIFGFYFFVILLLLITLFFSPAIRQVRGWLVFGPFQFQPSELAKVALIVLLAYFFAKRHIGIANPVNIFVSFVYLLIPVLIIFLQPDWGSALVLGGIWIGFLLISGIKWRHIAIGALLLVLFSFLSWNFFLAGYQKDRIVGFLKPSYEPLGVNYSVNQAKIAIGSGGLLGKGFRQGTQTQLGFLTEPATDFIFAGFIEEWGLLGGAFVVGLFLAVVLRVIVIGIKSENNFSQFLCLGTAILFVIEFMLNVGSNLGLLPVVGVTFPFFSYGGSSILTKAMLVGMIQSTVVRAHL